GELRVPDACIDPEHQVDGVEATSLPDLRTVGAEREAEAEHGAPPDGGGPATHHVGRDEVDRAAFVVGAPAAPVGDLAREGLQPLVHCESAPNRMDVRSSRSTPPPRWHPSRQATAAACIPLAKIAATERAGVDSRPATANLRC